MTQPQRIKEVSALRRMADDLAENGDVVAAIVLDEAAFKLLAGKEWREIIADVEVHPPYLN